MKIGLIAGNRKYPIIFSLAAKEKAPIYLSAVAFRGETTRRLAKYVDEIHWIEVGQLEALIRILKDSGIKEAVMIGQITPTRLFKKVKADSRFQQVLKGISEMNAENIFGAIAIELKKEGIELKDARLFLDKLLAQPGTITSIGLSESERQNLEFGKRIAKELAGLDIGQTIVVKNKTVVSVEGIEGTDRTILRGGRIARGNIVVVKVSKPNQDMRFDVPVIGPKTVETLKKAGGGVLAVEAGKVLILDKEHTTKLADRYGIKIVGI